MSHIDDQWIADGVAMVRQLRLGGHTLRAQELARWIELRAHPLLASMTPEQRWRRQRMLQNRATREKGCVVLGCTRQRNSHARPWCHRHHPRPDGARR